MIVSKIATTKQNPDAPKVQTHVEFDTSKTPTNTQTSVFDQFLRAPSAHATPTVFG
jgi:hypothetical protein